MFCLLPEPGALGLEFGTGVHALFLSSFLGFKCTCGGGRRVYGFFVCFLRGDAERSLG